MEGTGAEIGLGENSQTDRWFNKTKVFLNSLFGSQGSQFHLDQLK